MIVWIKIKLIMKYIYKIAAVVESVSDAFG